MSLFFQDIKNASDIIPWLDKGVKDVRYLPDIAPWLKLIVVKGGRTEATVDGRTVTAEAGDIIIIAPCEIHSFRSEACDADIINIPCDYTKMDIDLTLCASTGVIKRGASLNREIRDYAAILERELTDRTEGYSYMASGIARVLLSSLVKSGAIKETSPDEQKRREAEASLLTNVKKYISENYKESISLESASAYCNLSLFYFSHLFKRVTDITFYDYLTAYRLDIAIDILKSGSKKILSVGTECGFATVRTFNRSFKSFLGCSPSEYLEKIK